MSNTWFTADTHFGHKNMISWGDRPFSSVEEMDTYLLDLWNTTISPKDDVYFLGNLALHNPKTYIPKLNGHIYFIRGNHDTQSTSWYEKFPNIMWVKDFYRFKRLDIYIALMHYSMRIWPRSHYNSWHLFGHSHGRMGDLNTGKSFDVGIDAWDRILSLDEVVEIMKTKPNNFNYLEDRRKPQFWSFNDLIDKKTNFWKQRLEFYIKKIQWYGEFDKELYNMSLPIAMGDITNGKCPKCGTKLVDLTFEEMIGNTATAKCPKCNWFNDM